MLYPLPGLTPDTARDCAAPPHGHSVLRTMRAKVSHANIIHMVLTQIVIAILCVANPAATHGAGKTPPPGRIAVRHAGATQRIEPRMLPSRLALPAEPTIRQFTPGVEEPTLYKILDDLQTLPGPVIEERRSRAGGPGVVHGPAMRLDRGRLVDDPQGFVGQLLRASGQYVETRAIRLIDNPSSAPEVIWSSLIVDRRSRQPIQILTLSRPGDFGRLANVECLGYFYKIRRDQAQGPDRSGRRHVVEVPVLAGWIWRTPLAERQTSTFARYVLPAALAAVFLGFLLVVVMTRQRTDWRRRVEQGRSWRRRRDEFRDEGQDESQPHDQQ